MKKALFIVRAFDYIGPQSIRFNEIIRHLEKYLDIHLLCFSLTHFEHSLEKVNNLTIHRLPYSPIGRILNSGLRSGVNTPKGNDRTHKHLIYKTIRALGKSLLFPDIFIIEHLLSRKYVKNLANQNFDYVIGSAFPFSILLYAKLIKSISPKTQFIYDIGDPFFMNSVNNYLRNKMAFYFERHYLKFIDQLIVTNESTLIHYKQHFPKQTANKIHIIPQAFRVIREFKTQKTQSVKVAFPVQLIYAGNFYRKLREPYNLFSSIELTGIDKVELHVYGVVNKRFHRNLDNIKFLGAVPYNELLKAYERYHITVFIDNSKGFQTPGKIWELIALKKPILFISDRTDSPAMEIIRNYSGAIIVKNDINSITQGLNLMLKEFSNIKCNFKGEIKNWNELSEDFKSLLENLDKH